LAVDEISIRKGHNYLTVVLDYITGRVLFIGKNRKAKTLMRFFNQLKPKQRKAIHASGPAKHWTTGVHRPDP
jgi:Transposase.